LLDGRLTDGYVEKTPESQRTFTLVNDIREHVRPEIESLMAKSQFRAKAAEFANRLDMLWTWDFDELLTYAVSCLRGRTMPLFMDMDKQQQTAYKRCTVLDFETRLKRAALSWIISRGRRNPHDFSFFRLTLALAFDGMGIQTRGHKVMQALGVEVDYTTVYKCLKTIVGCTDLPHEILPPIREQKKALVLFLDNADSSVHIKHQRVDRKSTGILHTTLIGAFESPDVASLTAGSLGLDDLYRLTDKDWLNEFPNDPRTVTHFFDNGGEGLFDTESIFSKPEFKQYQEMEMLRVLLPMVQDPSARKSLESCLLHLATKQEEQCVEDDPQLYQKLNARVFANLPYLSTSHSGMAEVLLHIADTVASANLPKDEVFYIVVDGASLMRIREVTEKIVSGRTIKRGVVQTVDLVIKRVAEDELMGQINSSSNTTATSSSAGVTTAEDNLEDEVEEDDDDTDNAHEADTGAAFSDAELYAILQFVKRTRFVCPDLHTSFHHLEAISRYISPIIVYSYRALLKRTGLDPWSPQRHYYALHEAFQCVYDGLWQIALQEIVPQLPELATVSLSDELYEKAHSVEEWSTLARLVLDALRSSRPHYRSGPDGTREPSSTQWILDLLLFHGAIYLARCKAIRFGDSTFLVQAEPYLGLLFKSVGKHNYSKMMTFFTMQRCFSSRNERAMLTKLRTWSMTGRRRSNVAADERYEILIGSGQRFFDSRNGHNSQGLTDAEAVLACTLVNQLGRSLCTALKCSLYDSKNRHWGTPSLTQDVKAIERSPFLRNLVRGFILPPTEEELAGFRECIGVGDVAQKTYARLARFVEVAKVRNCVEKYSKFWSQWHDWYMADVSLRGVTVNGKPATWFRFLREIMRFKAVAIEAEPEWLVADLLSEGMFEEVLIDAVGAAYTANEESLWAERATRSSNIKRQKVCRIRGSIVHRGTAHLDRGSYVFLALD
jgi:hypothetical protein